MIKNGRFILRENAYMSYGVKWYFPVPEGWTFSSKGWRVLHSFPFQSFRSSDRSLWGNGVEPLKERSPLLPRTEISRTKMAARSVQKMSFRLSAVIPLDIGKDCAGNVITRTSEFPITRNSAGRSRGGQSAESSLFGRKKVSHSESVRSPNGLMENSAIQQPCRKTSRNSDSSPGIESRERACSTKISRPPPQLLSALSQRAWGRPCMLLLYTL